MTIASHADALILVAGVGRVRRQALDETRRVLERCPTFTLGVVATDGTASERDSLLERLRSVLPRRPFARVSASIRRVKLGRRRAPAKKAATRRAPAKTAKAAKTASARRNGGSGRAPSAGRRKPQKRPQRVPDG
jgi:hypothetical protein